MHQDVARAPAPLILKSLLVPLTSLLGIPALVRESPATVSWPDPGHEAHVILHREFPEHGPCPHLDGAAAFPADGHPPSLECPLGLTSRHFGITVGDEPWGVLVLGPYFTREADRQALAGRSRAADAALVLLPYLSPERQAAAMALCGGLVALAGSAAKASAVKETFLANMRHELRTPLNGVMGMLSLVLQGDLSPRHRQFLELAMDASNQLLALVNDLLEMHRISSERLVLTEEPFGLRQEIAPLLSAWAEDAAQRGLAFTADIEADVPEALWGDPTRIKQILLNLVQNAFNFTEYGAVTVRVSRVADRSDRDATILLFSVRDTGIGIPPERQVEIFDRFTIGENFLSKRHGRMGLGLSIAKDIVEKMGGVMSLESSPGLGSLFTFTAVLRNGALATPDLPLPLADQGRGALILVVEHEPISRLLVRRILENQGYVPIEADSNQTFLDSLRKRPVDMALVDLQAPRLDILEMVRRIRAGLEPEIESDLPIVALTTQEGQAACQIALGMNGCVSKPVTRQELLAAVEQALAAPPSRSLLKPHAV